VRKRLQKVDGKLQRAIAVCRAELGPDGAQLAAQAGGQQSNAA